MNSDPSSVPHVVMEAVKDLEITFKVDDLLQFEYGDSLNVGGVVIDLCDCQIDALLQGVTRFALQRLAEKLMKKDKVEEVIPVELGPKPADLINEINNLKAIIYDKDQAINSLTKSLCILDDRLLKMEDELEPTENTNKSLTDAIKEKDKQYDTLLEEFGKLNARFAEKAKESDEKDKLISGLRNTIGVLDTLAPLNEDLKKALQARDEQIKWHTITHRDMQSSIEQYRKKVDELEKEAIDLEVKIDEHTKKEARLETGYICAVNNIKKREDTIKELEKTIKGYEANIKEYEKTIEDYEATFKKHEWTIQECEETIRKSNRFEYELRTELKTLKESRLYLLGKMIIELEEKRELHMRPTSTIGYIVTKANIIKDFELTYSNV